MTRISIKNLLRRGFSLVMAVVFLTSALFWQGTVPISEAVTQAEIDALQNQAEEIAKAQEQLKSQLAIVSNDKSNATARKQIIEQEINLLQDEIENTEQQIILLDGMILRKVEEIQAAELEERNQYELFCQRVRIMEEAGEISYWGILFQSSDFSDLLDRIVMIDEIMEYDNKVMDDLIAIREKIIVEREELEVIKKDQQLIFVQQQAAKAEKEEQEAAVDKLIAEIAAQEAELKALNARLEEAAASMDAEIRRKEEELEAYLASLGSSIVSESGFLWPLSSHATLSSLFGSRIHPITGSANNHTGIDIPAPSGTPILAAKSGIVLTSEYHYSYGNYIVVSHGGGETTLYAHMVKLGLPEGTAVNQGDPIGYVGTTGSSTGNHLHYEIRFDGTRYDPVNYYPDKILYVQSGGSTVILSH